MRWKFFSNMANIIISVLLSTVGVADQAIIVDSTGPFTGTVFDGPNFKTDLQFSKDEDMVTILFI